MAEAKYKVTGIFPIKGIDGEDVAPGGTVELDDAAPGINVRALLEAGLVSPVDAAPAKSAAKSKPAEGGDG